MRTTNVFSRNLQAFVNPSIRLAINQGGTGSSKTYSVLQLLYIIADIFKGQNNVISIVSESLPHLRRGVMRDFFNIISPNYIANNHNKTEHIYKVRNNIIEFFGADDETKVRGSRRDYLFINECINVSHETYRQLAVRTRKKIFLDFNPSYEFWAHDEANRTDAVLIKSTYRDNPHIEQALIDEIERIRLIDPNWYRVFGEGEIGRYEGLVFNNWDIVDSMPEGGETYYGMDYGFTNDPTTLIKVIDYKNEIWLEELLYERGLTNDDISEKLESSGLRRGYDEIFADCAEPKSTEEIYRLGWNIKGAPKGEDSIRFGIQLLKQFKLHIVKSSINLIKEARNYRYVEDKDGHMTGKPIDKFNHCWDAIRYAKAGKNDYSEPGVFVV